MKKSIVILAAFAAAALVSCEKQEVRPAAEEGSAVVFSASLEGATKTVLAEGNKVEWLATDKIAIFDGTTAVESTASGAGATASFSATLSGSGPWYALYPYSASATISSDVITTSVPAGQEAVAGSFADGLNIAVAYSSGTALAFKNVLGYIKFNMGCDFIKKVTITGNASEKLAGKVAVSYNAGEPAATVSDGVEAITLAPASGYFEKGKDYYVAVIPQTLSAGFKLVYDDAFGGTHEFSTSNSAVIGRSKIININCVDGGVLVDGPISFACAAVKADLLKNGIGGGIASGEIYISEAAAVSYAQLSAFDSEVPAAEPYRRAPSLLWTDASAITSFDELKYFVGLERASGKYRLPSLFTQCTNLTSVQIPYNITELSNYCFQRCTSLTSIILPEGLTNIYGRCFAGCAALKESEPGSGVFKIPATVTNISTQAFYGCASLTEVDNAGNTFENIGIGAFSGCTEMTFKSRAFTSLETLGRAAFALTSITQMNLKTSKVTEIPDSLFYNNKSLKTIFTNNNITSIGAYAFYGCSSLEHFNTSGSGGTLVTPNACTKIGTVCFSHCYKLAKNGATINEGLTTIGARAFRYMKVMRNIELPSTLTGVSYGLFSGNSSNPMEVAIVCKAVTPPAMTHTNKNLAENYTYSDITSIKVPSASVDSYKAADGWKDCASVITAIE